MTTGVLDRPTVRVKQVMQAAAKVLIVDDALFLRMILRDTLLRLGCHVAAEAADGYQAVELYPQAQPDVVFLDLFMPNIDGISTLRELLKRDPHARVIACSSNNKEEFVREAMLNGALDYLVKPLDEGRVATSLQRALLVRPDRPQAIVEELLAWYDPGDQALRTGLVSPESLLTARRAVQSGAIKGLPRALRDEAGMDEEDIQTLLEDSHRDVGLALVLLKSRAITLVQLRCALVIIRQSGRRLGFTLVEQGFCNQAQIAEALKVVPPYNRTDL